MISSPRRQCAARASRFVMVPEGPNRPASLPSSPATVSSSRCTVLSSPYMASPTSALYMARRIPLHGRVNVSLRSSTASRVCGDIKCGRRSADPSAATYDPCLCRPGLHSRPLRIDPHGHSFFTTPPSRNAPGLTLLALAKVRVSTSSACVNAAAAAAAVVADRGRGRSR